MAVLLTPPKLQFLDNNGDPLAFGKVNTYTSSGGTFTTRKATYTTEAGTVENSNPVVLDAAGRANIWIDGSYDFSITDANDVQLYTQLAVTAFTALPAESDSFFQSFSGNSTQTVFTLSEDLGTDENSVFVFVDNSNLDYITNGTFATDTGWTKGSGWVIGSGVATATTSSAALEQTAANALVEGNVYTVTYTITRSSGTVTPSIGGTSGVARNASGTYTETIIAGSTQVVAFTGSGFSGTVDNVTTKVANPEGFQIQAPTSFTLTGASLTLTSAPADDTNNIYVFAPSLLVGAASSAAAAAEASAAAALASENAAATSETNAATSETNAAVSEVSAAASAAKLEGTSTTSLAIGTGAKVFTTQVDKFFDAGNFLLITSDADPANYMHGQVTSYSGTTLTIDITNVGGSGTLADWTIRVSGTRGSTGATGATGPAGSISDLTGVPTATVATGDYIIFTDVDDSDTTKRDTVQGILDLIPAAGYTLATPQATTSGSDKTFTGIPSGTTQIIINFDRVSITGSGPSSVRIGDSGGLETTGYSDGGWSATGSAISGMDGLTTGFMINTGAASDVLNGSFVLSLANSSSNLWVAHYVLTGTGDSDVFIGAGTKELSAELTQLSIVPSGNFDAGAINIMYI